MIIKLRPEDKIFDKGNGKIFLRNKGQLVTNFF